MTTSRSHAELTDEVSRSLYARAEKIYPRAVHGLFATCRVSAVLVLLGLFYGVAWLQWDGRQLLLFDLPARKFYLLGATFFPQDLLYLSLMLIVAALALFFFTALAGRLWCGYACPQTVWTEVFLWIERRIEGDRLKRMKLDQQPWQRRKLLTKAIKHAVWVALSLWTGFTFVGYFTPIIELGGRALSLELGPWESFWVLFYGFATYGNAGWMREQVCIYLCPYARFQSAMFDTDTLIISYDRQRGEPRGSRKRGVGPRAAGLGDCINCTLCVQVCPTGIDIRDGLQYQCIGCASCIDVCDQVMEKMHYAKGLIRYTTENALTGKPTRLLRPRIVIYSLGLALLAVGLVISVLARTPLEVDVIRDRNALYRETHKGLIENVYTIRIVNKDNEAHRYRVTVQSELDLTLVLEDPEPSVSAGEVRSIVARLRASSDALKTRSTGLRFVVESTTDADVRLEEEARFLGPLNP